MLFFMAKPAGWHRFLSGIFADMFSMALSLANATPQVPLNPGFSMDSYLRLHGFQVASAWAETAL